jgi:UDP-N-acetyl-2-amino-2-deoxyglucuronate dehydrogenase
VRIANRRAQEFELGGAALFDNRIWSHKYPGQTDWIELLSVLPDSSNASHHPFQAKIDHFVECIRQNRPSHGSLDDTIKTHEIAFAAKQSAQTNLPVRLPLLAA